MKKYFCDSCGRNIAKADDLFFIRISAAYQLDKEHRDFEGAERHLCFECIRRLSGVKSNCNTNYKNNNEKGKYNDRT